MKNPKIWLVVMLIALLLICMMIAKHHNEAEDLQQKIYDHSEIKDTI